MPKREVAQSIILVREVASKKAGEKSTVQRIELKPGQVFDFTAEELSQIDPNAVTSQVTVDLDQAEDAVIKRETKLSTAQTNAPAATATADL